MDPKAVKARLKEILKLCPCGSGRMYYYCDGQEESADIAMEMCPCGSGKMVRDCAMKSADSHIAMLEGTK